MNVKHSPILRVELYQNPEIIMGQNKTKFKNNSQFWLINLSTNQLNCYNITHIDKHLVNHKFLQQSDSLKFMVYKYFSLTSNITLICKNVTKIFHHLHL